MSFNIEKLFNIAGDRNTTFNDVLSYIKEHYFVLPSKFQINEHVNPKGSNLGSLAIVSIILEHKLQVRDALKLFKEYYDECCDENSNPESHRNIRALMKLENTDEINIAQNCLYLRSDLESSVNKLFDDIKNITPDNKAAKTVVEVCVGALNLGIARTAEKINGEWVVHQWLKKAVLLSFKIWDNEVIDGAESQFFDKVPLKYAIKYEKYSKERFVADGVRVVPGSIVRTGSFVGKNVVLMPSFVNIGAFVDEGTMVDTWATVGSCAQIGKNTHLSGGVGIGGVLEPLQAAPTIIEDNCFIGARSEIVEGVIVEEGSVISMGVYISQSTPILDRKTGEITYGRIPPYSVVIAGAIHLKGDNNYSPIGAVIVKTVDAKTRAKVSTNELLRMINDQQVVEAFDNK